MNLLVKVGAIAMVGLTLSHAQPTPPAPAPPAAGVTVGPSVQMTFTQQRQQATALESQAKGDKEHVVRLADRANKEGDSIKKGCVNDKLVVILPELNRLEPLVKGFMNVTEQDPSRNDRFDEVAVIAGNIRTQRLEADECVGEVTLAGDTEPSFTGPDQVDNPFGDGPFDFEPAIDDEPGYSSPTGM